MSGECDRARQWASTELDGELSSFERVLLHAHLDACPACSAFRSEIGGLTGTLREAPFEQLASPIEIAHPRRRLSLRLAPAAAAMAVAAVGLGSLLASSAVRSGSVAVAQAQAPRVLTGQLGAVDTMNLRTSTAIQRMNAFQQMRLTNARRTLRGGPVLFDR
jgi:predicted anti-sigma-YlaC factor YlaD